MGGTTCWLAKQDTPRMTTNAVMLKHPTAIWKRKPSMMSPAPTMMAMDRREVQFTRKPKQDCYNILRKVEVEICKTDVRSSPISPPSQWMSKPLLLAKEDLRTGDEGPSQESLKVQLFKDCKEQPREMFDQFKKETIHT